MNRSELELMAPVGSRESLQAAIQAGANSIYLGIEKLNMRARSTVNFTLSDVPELVETCRKNNLKLYITLNTVIYNDEISVVIDILKTLKKHNVNAIIASDMAVIQNAIQIGVPVHMSTQVNISNSEAVKYYSAFADVMVLARELNLTQVFDIYQSIKKNNITGPSGKQVQIEMFSHGALCMSISGKCYLSLHEQNYSANRGACLQNCRKGYTVIEKESGRELDVDNEYIMSPKDLCTIHFLNKMIDAGVRIFKIEGRARSPEYVYKVIKCYNEALNAYCDNDYTDDKIKIWKKELESVFNRGFWDGYYLGQRLGEWSNVYGSKASKKKEYIGKVTNFFTNIGVAEILCETGTMSVNDDTLIIGKTTGVLEQRIQAIKVNNINVTEVKKGERFSIKTDQLVRRNDKIYKLVSEKKLIFEK